MLTRLDNPLLTKFVGPREADVLRAVWEGNHTAGAIRAYVQQDAAAINKATVGVHLHQLTKKGLLARAHNGLAFHYQPIAPDERSFVEQQIARVIEALHEDYPDELAAVLTRMEL